MKRSRKLLVIGGVAAGTKAASKAKRDDPTLDVTILTDEQDISYAGCGLAYYIGGVITDRRKLFARTPAQFKEKQDITVLTGHRADRISTWDHVVKATCIATGEQLTFPFDKLVIATGASAVIPPIPGIGKEGVFPLRSISNADAVKAYLSNNTVRSACVIGGGYIGAEMGENLARLGISVTMFEMTNSIMGQLFDPAVAATIAEYMVQSGVTVKTGTMVEQINGDRQVRSVIAGGAEYACELVIVAAGVQPNVGLAREARIAIGPTGAIKVDRHMETSARGIYAAGDCAEQTNIVSGKPCWVPLGSTANKQGRVAGSCLAGGRLEFPGVLGTSIVKVFDMTVARTGLNEREAREAGFDPVSVTVTVPSKAGYYPGSGKLSVTLTGDKRSRRFIGAQVTGDATADKVIDTCAAALMGKLSVDDLVNVDISYSPPYSPALGNVIVAASVLEGKL